MVFQREEKMRVRFPNGFGDWQAMYTDGDRRADVSCDLLGHHLQLELQSESRSLRHGTGSLET